MTRNKNSNLEPFDPEIERNLRRLRNLVEDKVSPKKERPTMEEQQAFKPLGDPSGRVIVSWGLTRTIPTNILLHLSSTPIWPIFPINFKNKHNINFKI